MTISSISFSSRTNSFDRVSSTLQASAVSAVITVAPLLVLRQLLLSLLVLRLPGAFVLRTASDTAERAPRHCAGHGSLSGTASNCPDPKPERTATQTAFTHAALDAFLLLRRRCGRRC